MNQDNQYQLSHGEQLVNVILNDTAKVIKNKYNLQPSGEGAAMPGGSIRKLNLSFDTKARYKKQELRELLIKCAEELLNQVNANKEIQQFLIKTPFTIENVQIIIYNHDKDGRGLKDPEISTAQILGGILDYATVDPNDSFRYKNEFKETYDEAIKTLQNQ